MKHESDPTLHEQSAIQREQDGKAGQTKQTKPHGKGQAVQAGARGQPLSTSAQHLAKPGSEAEFDPQPHFMAPEHRGSGKLQGLSHWSPAPIRASAEQTLRCVEAEGRRCLLLQGDVRTSAWCEQAVA